MKTFDERYKKEALELFLARTPLEHREKGGDWKPANEGLTALVYKSLNTGDAVRLAKGVLMSDGSEVRFRLARISQQQLEGSL